MEEVDALLFVAKEQLDAVRSMYEASLREERVPPILGARIKNVLENQRSALDYLAWGIARRWGKAGSDTYYPMAESPDVFPATLKRNLARVGDVRPDIRDAIERHQPYRHEWMRHLQKLVRHHKHRRPTPQIRREHRRREFPGPPEPESYRVTDSPHDAAVVIGDDISWDIDHLSIGEGGGIWIDGVPVHETAPIVVYVEWRFNDPDLPVLGTLTDVHKASPHPLRISAE